MDIATGSAAGPAGAYLGTHGLVSPAQTIEISQGRFVGRPSTLFVVAKKKTLKGRLALRSQATLLLSQEVNSRFEASEGRFKSSSSSAGSARAGASGLGVTKTVPCHLALQATDRDSINKPKNQAERDCDHSQSHASRGQPHPHTRTKTGDGLNTPGSFSNRFTSGL